MAMLFQIFKTLQNYDSQNEIYAFKNTDFHFENIITHFVMLVGVYLSFKTLACLSSLPCLNHDHELKARLQQFD